MALDPRTFLAAAVMNDGKIVGSCPNHYNTATDFRLFKVSYRSLGRELKVHSNIAKK